MVGINYIIATYAGKTSGRLLDKNSEFVLDKQLDVLYNLFLKKKELGIENLIEQITIVYPTTVNDPYPNYYQTEKWQNMFKNIVFLQYIGQNKHHSYDQYIQAMQKYQEYDYNIIIEDDYCISLDNPYFDLELVQEYKEKFPQNIGYLCTWCPDYPPWAPKHAAISNGMISKATIQSIKNPLEYFYTLRDHSQKMFSYLFTDHGIELKDISDKYKIFFYYTGDPVIQDYSSVNSNKLIFMPIQMLYPPLEIKKML